MAGRRRGEGADGTAHRGAGATGRWVPRDRRPSRGSDLRGGARRPGARVAGDSRSPCGRRRSLPRRRRASAQGSPGAGTAVPARVERIRPQPRGLADLGWDVRATLATAPEEVREALSRLARDLFDASRAAAEADHALAVVDRKELVRHLTDTRAQAVLSKAAAREVESTARRLDALDA